jgi:hypothetical protein
MFMVVYTSVLPGQLGRTNLEPSMELNCLYRHQDNLTCALEVLWQKDMITHLELTVAWWAVGTKRKAAPMNRTQTIKLQKDRLDEWIKMGYTDTLVNANTMAPVYDPATATPKA